MTRARLAGVLATLALLAGCATRTGRGVTLQPPTATRPVPPVTNEDEYTTVRADYDALPITSPDRPLRRAALRAWLLRQANRALDGDHLEEAHELLQKAASLWDASELWDGARDPELLEAARRADRAFRKRGDHTEVTLALALQIGLGTPAEADAARKRFAEMTHWLVAAMGDSDAARAEGRERVIEDLEAASKVFPSRFVVETLTQYLFDRPPSAQLGLLPRRLKRGADLSELLAGANKSGLSYELARLYLRAGKPELLAQVLARHAGKPGDDAQLRQQVERAFGSAGTPEDVVSLASVFAPSQSVGDRDVSLAVCQAATRRFPQAAPVWQCAGTYALELGQLGIALHCFEEARRLAPAERQAWESLAKLYLARLSQVASDENLDVAAMERDVKQVEAFHKEAQERFPDKPLRPPVSAVLYEVGRGYYNAGRLTEATRYLERAVALEPNAGGLELMAQIRLKKGDAKAALALLQRAMEVPKDDRDMRVWWRAKLRRLVAEAHEALGEAKEAEQTRKEALADWDYLLGRGLVKPAQAEAAVEKGKLHYLLGDRDQSLDWFRRAVDTAPDRGSTYADVLAFLVPRGELAEALDAYHRALGRNEVTEYLKVYCSLWVLDLARRAGEPEDPLAAAFLRSTDGARWYDDLARWATGRQSDEALMKRADTPGRRAEASFYRAMRAVAEGRMADARALWQEVLETDMMAFFEYDMAALFLKLGQVPSQPLLKSSGKKPPAATQPAASANSPDEI